MCHSQRTDRHKVMIEIKRTWLASHIKHVVGEVWEHIADDSQIEEYAMWTPRVKEDSRWYATMEDDDVVGIFWMRRVNAITWEAHANVRPKYWGDKKGTEHCRLAIDHMIADTGARKVVALIPDSSPQVQKMAEAIGFVAEGKQTDSYLKNGKVYDQVHYGMTRKPT